jgi:hypothetical protein
VKPLKPTPVLPPEHLLDLCSVEQPQIGTNGDLAKTVIGLKAAIDQCNADKAALKAWAEKVKTP